MTNSTYKYCKLTPCFAVSTLNFVFTLLNRTPFPMGKLVLEFWPFHLPLAVQAPLRVQGLPLDKKVGFTFVLLPSWIVLTHLGKLSFSTGIFFPISQNSAARDYGASCHLPTILAALHEYRRQEALLLFQQQQCCSVKKSYPKAQWVCTWRAPCREREGQSYHKWL